MALEPRHAKDAVLTIDIGGSTSALSTSFDDSNFAQAVDATETTTYKDGDREYIPGLKNSNMSFSGLMDHTTYTLLQGQIGASTNPTLQYSPASTAAGRLLLKVGAVITGLTVSGAVGDRVNCAVTCQGSGAVTSTVH